MDVDAVLKHGIAVKHQATAGTVSLSLVPTPASSGPWLADLRSNYLGRAVVKALSGLLGRLGSRKSAPERPDLDGNAK